MAEMAGWKKGAQVKGEDQEPELHSGGGSGEERLFGSVDTDIAIA